MSPEELLRKRKVLEPHLYTVEEKLARRAAEELAIYSRLTLEEAVLFLSACLSDGSLTDSESTGKPVSAVHQPTGKREG